MQVNKVLPEGNTVGKDKYVDPKTTDYLEEEGGGSHTGPLLEWCQNYSQRLCHE